MYVEVGAGVAARVDGAVQDARERAGLAGIDLDDLLDAIELRPARDESQVATGGHGQSFIAGPRVQLVGADAADAVARRDPERRVLVGRALADQGEAAGLA